ncbi:hypothetical protein ABZU32_34200 [Sphaerisporangium sp. NPDC005288]
MSVAPIIGRPLSAGPVSLTTPELDYTGTGYAMLRARSTSVGAWEKLR